MCRRLWLSSTSSERVRSASSTCARRYLRRGHCAGAANCEGAVGDPSGPRPEPDGHLRRKPLDRLFLGDRPVHKPEPRRPRHHRSRLPVRSARRWPARPASTAGALAALARDRRRSPSSIGALGRRHRSRPKGSQWTSRARRARRDAETDDPQEPTSKPPCSSAAGSRTRRRTASGPSCKKRGWSACAPANTSFMRVSCGRRDRRRLRRRVGRPRRAHPGAGLRAAPCGRRSRRRVVRPQPRHERAVAQLARDRIVARAPRAHFGLAGDRGLPAGPRRAPLPQRVDFAPPSLERRPLARHFMHQHRTHTQGKIPTDSAINLVIEPRHHFSRERRRRPNDGESHAAPVFVIQANLDDMRARRSLQSAFNGAQHGISQ